MAAIESAYLTLAEARALIDSAISEATTKGETASVVIVDVGGGGGAEARGGAGALDSPEVARQGGPPCARGTAVCQKKSRPLSAGGEAGGRRCSARPHN